MKEFMRGCSGVLRSLISETVIFIAGIEAAERHPEAAVSLARTCMELLSDAMVQLSHLDRRDEHVERAYEELKIARELFKSVATGEPISITARKYVSQGAAGRKILILDIAHGHTHGAINSLKKSKNFELYHEPIQLLSEAGKESAPTTLYRLAYRMAGT